MIIRLNTKNGEVHIGSKKFGLDMSKQNENAVIYNFNKFLIDNTKLSDYEEDSMWMSYRYCIGRHTIASHMRASDIKNNCYGRISDERSVFTAYDINREIEDKLGFGYPNFFFPITSLNKIYTSAIDIFCEFITDNNITKWNEFFEYKDIHVELSDENERGYVIFAETWDDWKNKEFNKLCKKHNILIDDENDINVDELKKIEDFNYFYKTLDKHPNCDYFLRMNFFDLFVWNDLVHIFDLEHHHKCILVDGTECEYFYTWVEGYDVDENGKRKEISLRKIKVPVDKWNGSVTCYIPEENISKELY